MSGMTGIRIKQQPLPKNYFRLLLIIRRQFLEILFKFVKTKK